MLQQFPPKWHDATLRNLEEYEDLTGFTVKPDVPLQLELPQSGPGGRGVEKSTRQKLQATYTRRTPAGFIAINNWALRLTFY